MVEPAPDAGASAGAARGGWTPIPPSSDDTSAHTEAAPGERPFVSPPDVEGWDDAPRRAASDADRYPSGAPQHDNPPRAYPSYPPAYAPGADDSTPDDGTPDDDAFVRPPVPSLYEGDDALPEAVSANGAAGAAPPYASYPSYAGASPYGGGYTAEPAAPRRSAGAVVFPWGLRGIAETLEVLALALIMFLLVRGVAQNFIVEGGSMEPTLQSGEMLIVNKLSYRSFDLSWIPGVDKDDWRPFGSPSAGDVIVFRFPQDPDRDFIKRVIAVPGDTVEVANGVVKVNGVIREEPFLGQPTEYKFGPETVPPEHLFVLGDNRNNSYDSHSWGMLQQSLVIGRAELRYWPFGKFGRVDHERPPEAAAGVSRSPSTPR